MRYSVNGKELWNRLNDLQKITEFELYGETFSKAELQEIINLRTAPWIPRKRYELYPVGRWIDGHYSTIEIWRRRADTRVMTGKGLQSWYDIVDTAKSELKTRIDFVQLEESAVPIKLLKEYCKVWPGPFEIEVNGNVTLKANSGRNITNLIARDESNSHDVRTTPMPWNTRALELVPVVNKQEERPMTQENRQFDPAAMDAAAREFEQELQKILANGNKATDLCALVAQSYIKAGHKRIGRALVKVGKA